MNLERPLSELPRIIKSDWSDRNLDKRPSSVTANSSDTGLAAFRGAPGKSVRYVEPSAYFKSPGLAAPLPEPAHRHPQAAFPYSMPQPVPAQPIRDDEPVTPFTELARHLPPVHSASPMAREVIRPMAPTYSAMAQPAPKAGGALSLISRLAGVAMMIMALVLVNKIDSKSQEFRQSMQTALGMLTRMLADTRLLDQRVQTAAEVSEKVVDLTIKAKQNVADLDEAATRAEDSLANHESDLRNLPKMQKATAELKAQADEPAEAPPAPSAPAPEASGASSPYQQRRASKVPPRL